jgi:hypothetical protein
MAAESKSAKGCAFFYLLCVFYALTVLHRQNMQKLIDTVNKLQDAFTILGTGNMMLPQVETPILLLF